MSSEIRVTGEQCAGQAAVDEGKADRNQRKAEKLPREQPLMENERAEDHRGRGRHKGHEQHIGRPASERMRK